MSDSKMKFPSTKDFLDILNIRPTEEDPGMAYCRYVKYSDDGIMKIDVSFSAVTESFQVVFQCAGRDVVTISSEKTRLIEIQSDDAGLRIHAIFDISGLASEAMVTFEPQLHCHWWALRN
jgi:hypothetical protein